MAEKQSSPDLPARGKAVVVGTVVSLGVSILSLVLAYSNFRWQREIQEESAAERILVHLDASVTESPDPKCELVMEVVNAGLRPLFIKSAMMKIGGEGFIFYEHDPTKTNETMKSLGPSEAIRYRLRDWHSTRLKFTVMRRTEWRQPVAGAPVQRDEGIRVEWVEAPELQDVEVVVQTTKKTFSFHPDAVNIALVATLPQGRKSTSKQALPDH